MMKTERRFCFFMNQIFINKNDAYLKGNLHTHTNASDGRYPVSEVVRIYVEKGYDFVGITDHDVYFRGCAEEAGLVVLAGEEVSCNYVGDDFYKAAYAHFCCFHKTRQTENHFTYKNAEELADCITRLCDRYEFVQFNHPMFSRFSDDEMLLLRGFHAMEVYNHKDFYKETGLNGADALVRFLFNHKKKFFLTAGDDFHGPFKNTVHDFCCGGWIKVKAEKNEKAILAALKHGDFYASTGPEILDFRREDHVFRIETTPAQHIIFYTNDRRCKHICDDDGKDVTVGELVLRPTDYYVWVRVIDGQGNCAWTQPIFL